MHRTAPWYLLFAIPLFGCVSLQSVTAGQVGCPAEEIRIINDDSGFGSRTWTASCNGKIFYCSAHGGGQYSTPQVACKEQADPANAAPPPAAAPPAGGCQYDTQCKGDRVCKSGRCVDPTPK